MQSMSSHPIPSTEVLMSGLHCSYWGVELNGIAALSTALSIGATSAIIDSGSTAIMVSNEDADAIHAVGH